MRITAIKAQLKNTQRVSLYVDGAYAFSLTQSQLLEQRLLVGKELTDQELTSLKEESNYGKLLERVMNYVMIRPRSVREVRDYLWRKQANPDSADHIIHYLETRGYLNDLAFAKSWVGARQLTKPVSTRRLVAELNQKGVSDDLIRLALDDKDYSEEQALRQIVTKKRRLARYREGNKLMQYLARQGFGYASIKTVLDDMDIPLL